MKKNILIDAAIFQSALYKNNSRSGIFFTAINIVKQFLDNENFEVFFYCSNNEIKKALDICFNEKTFKIYNQSSVVERYYEFLKCKKQLAKEKNRKIKKNIIMMKMGLVKPLVKLFSLKSTAYNDIDIFFSPFLQIPEHIEKKKHIKKYTIVYDTIPLLLSEYYPKVESGCYWFKKLIEQMNNEDHYFAISESAKNDFLKFVPDLKPENITVTPLACSETFKPEKEKTQKALEKYNLPTDKKYIFSLCTLEPRKNLIRAIRTFIEFIKKNKIDDLVFILGGGHWAEFIGTLEKEIDGLAQYKDKIIKAGYIDDEDLAPLYSGAEWFVYTSQYEGFGLPPLEAMACGCPVITSNNSSLPEVVGDAGQMIDWDSDEQHIAAYEKYYFDKKFKNEMAQKGYERSKQFSWQKCADTMIREMLKED